MGCRMSHGICCWPGRRRCSEKEASASQLTHKEQVWLPPVINAHPVVLFIDVSFLYCYARDADDHCLLTSDAFGPAGDLFTEAAEAAMQAMKGRLANQYYMKAEEAWALMEE